MIIIGVQDYLLNANHQDMVAVREYAEEDEPPAPLEFLQFSEQFHGWWTFHAKICERRIELVCFVTQCS